jgi:phospholipase/lecithinase/hemolysin
MIKSIALALVASAALCLAGCASTAQLESFNTNAQTTLLAAQQTVAADAKLGLIDPVTASKIGAAINAANAALEAANDALMAHDATTAQQKQQEVQAAILEINNAILSAVQAARTP